MISKNVSILIYWTGGYISASRFGPGVYGLKWTKCPAIKNFHQNVIERLLQTSKEYQMFA